MYAINQIPPGRMTPQQRRHEIASLLANGIARLRMSSALQSTNSDRQRDVLLAIRGHQSVHTDPVNKLKTESK